MNAKPLQIGQVVQLNPQTVTNPMFAGCLMQVTEPKSWGAQGFVQALGEDGKPGGHAYYRATWDQMDELEPGSIAPWQPAPHLED